jgi:hypothetical protein
MYYHMPTAAYYKPVIMRSQLPIYLEPEEPASKTISVLDNNIDSFSQFSVQHKYYSNNRLQVSNSYKS